MSGEVAMTLLSRQQVLASRETILAAQSFEHHFGVPNTQLTELGQSGAASERLGYFRA
jgi:hypothetical protein